MSTLHAIISAGAAKQRNNYRAQAPSLGSPRHYSSSLVWLRCVDAQWDVGRADQIRHRVLGWRQTETCPLPPWGTFTGVNPAAIHKRTGHARAISTVVVTCSHELSSQRLQVAIIFFTIITNVSDDILMNIAHILRLSNKYFCQRPWIPGNKNLGKSSKTLLIRFSVAHLVSELRGRHNVAPA